MSRLPAKREPRRQSIKNVHQHATTQYSMAGQDRKFGRRGEVYVSTVIDAPIDVVWALAGRFADLSWSGTVSHYVGWCLPSYAIVLYLDSLMTSDWKPTRKKCRGGSLQGRQRGGQEPLDPFGRQDRTGDPHRLLLHRMPSTLARRLLCAFSPLLLFIICRNTSTRITSSILMMVCFQESSSTTMPACPSSP